MLARRRWARLPCALLVVWSSSPARAQPLAPGEGPTVETHWTAPSGCPASTFTDALERLLVGSTVHTTIRVDARVIEQAEGWQVDASFDAGPKLRGRRSFRAPACSTVASAAALAIAIVVDPTVLDRLAAVPPDDDEAATDSEPEPEPDSILPEPTEAMGSAPPEDVEPELGPIEAIDATAAADRPSAEAASSWRWLLGAGPSIDGGALPGPGAGLVAITGVARGWFRGELWGTYRGRTRVALTEDSTAGGTFQQWTVSASGCAAPRVGPLELPMCAGLESGQTIGRGFGVLRIQTARRPWLAVLGSAGVAWPIVPRMALLARASLAAPLLRPEFSIVGRGPVHRIGPVQARGVLAVELRLP